jgi:hypothetical protein
VSPTTPSGQRRQAWHPPGLGSSRFARRYSGNRCCFLFLRVLRWFTSPGRPPRDYVFIARITQVLCAGFPHSDIDGSRDVCSSPSLIAAYHVLPRLCAPRHPPCALGSLPTFRPICKLFPRTRTLVSRRKLGIRLVSESTSYSSVKDPRRLRGEIKTSIARDPRKREDPHFRIRAPYWRCRSGEPERPKSRRIDVSKLDRRVRGEWKGSSGRESPHRPVL